MMASDQQRPLLEVRNLRAELPTKRGMLKAVDQVSFSLHRGEALGIVGESGCGKSMLARAIMGLLPANAVVHEKSIVRLDGRNLVALSKKELRKVVGRKIAYIFQDPMTSLNPVMKIGRQIAEVIQYHLKASRQTAQKRAIELLDRVGIPMPDRRARQFPHQLSGGLRQRAAIAIALACDPLLLIADEPTTALDVTVQAAILSLLSGFQKERRRSMILISHDFGVIAGWTHMAAVMYAGRFVEQAPTGDLFRAPRMPYTHALMAAMPRLSNPPHTPLQTIAGQPPDLARLPEGCRFATRCRRKQPKCGEQEPGLKRIDNQGHRLACWYPMNENGK